MRFEDAAVPRATQFSTYDTLNFSLSNLPMLEFFEFL